MGICCSRKKSEDNHPENEYFISSEREDLFRPSSERKRLIDYYITPGKRHKYSVLQTYPIESNSIKDNQHTKQSYNSSFSDNYDPSCFVMSDNWDNEDFQVADTSNNDKPSGDKFPERKDSGKKYPKFKNPALPKHLRGDFHRPKSNSTSSIYITNSIVNPDVEEIVRCMSKAIHYHMQQGHKVPEEERLLPQIFDENKHPITHTVSNLHEIPQVGVIFSFLNTIFKAERLSAECAILCLAYTERIIEHSGLTLCASNWRRVVLATLILASKVWEDQAVWNVDFLSVFPQVTVSDLNQLEKKVLAFLSFNVSLKRSAYAKYFFELRNYSTLGEDQFPLKPLDKEQQQRLEQRSEGLESEHRSKSEKRTQSHSDLKPLKSPQVILN